VMGPRPAANFAVLMTDLMPDVASFVYTIQFFPRWTYETAESPDDQLDLSSEHEDVDEWGYRRIDNITDEIYALYAEAVGEVSKDDIFYYVYGILHDPTYREQYAADLKKMLPHIPTPETRGDFDKYTSAGRALAALHLGYENITPYPVDLQLKKDADPADRETWRVKKMRWAKKKDPDTGRNVDDKTTLIVNPHVTITGIPEEADRYMLGSRSALGWILDRYQVKTDKVSGITNDPNDWADEHGDPRYIVDLIAKVTTVAVETVKIVDRLVND